jgi:methanogenic corrinoid protein MtbC1
MADTIDSLEREIADRQERLAALKSKPLTTAEAAQLARAEEPVGAEPERSLLDALLAFDETAAHAAFDRLLADLGRDAVLRDGVLPTLRAIGDGWERGDVTIAQEHFASGMLRGRLLGLARGWDRGSGPRALLAAPSGERHDLGLIVFGLALRELGWRVTLLGADTPLPTLREAADRLMPAVVVIAALESAPLERAAAELAELGAAVRVVLAGGGATRAIAVAAGAGLLPDDPFEAAEMLAASAA